MKPPYYSLLNLFFSVVICCNGCNLGSSGTKTPAEEEKEIQLRHIQDLQLKTYRTSINSLMMAERKVIQYAGMDRAKLARAMGELDLSHCPADFAEVYKSYIRAWENAAKVQQIQNRLDTTDGADNAVLSDICCCAGELEHRAINDIIEAGIVLRKLEIQRNDLIQQAYFRVSKLAKLYGTSYGNPPIIHSGEAGN